MTEQANSSLHVGDTVKLKRGVQDRWISPFGRVVKPCGDRGLSDCALIEWNSTGTQQWVGHEELEPQVEQRIPARGAIELKELLHEIRMLALEAEAGTRFGAHPERATGEESAYRHVESLIEERLGRALGKTPEPLDNRAQMRDRLEQEYGRPVLPVPQGVTVAGTLERIEPTAPERAAAIVVGAEATHIVHVTQQAEQLVGQRVELRNAAGVVRLAAAPSTIAVTRESISREAARQHSRPVIGNFHGAEGILDRVVGDGAGVYWAVVVGAQSIHVVRSSEAARGSIGERVTLEAGNAGFELRARTPSLGR